jgi:hypothetical protein
VLGILGDDHLGQQRFGGQSALNEMRRRRSLAYSGAALGAGITRTDGDDHLELGRCDVEPLCAVLSDPDHGPAPAEAGDTCRFDHPLDAWQLLRQGAGAALLAFDIVVARGSGSVRNGFPDFSDRDLDVLECQLQLIRTQLLRSWSKLSAAKLAHQVLKPEIGLFEKRVLRFEIGLLRLQLPPRETLSIQCGGLLGKRSGLRLECRPEAAQRGGIKGCGHRETVAEPRHCGHSNARADSICRSWRPHPGHSDAPPVESL